MFILQSILAALLLAQSPQDYFFDGWSNQSVLTVNHKLEIPGMILSPGSYTFSLEQRSGERYLVKVVGSDGLTVTTLSAIREYRLNEKGATFTYFKKSEGPAALQSWFHKSSQYGFTFVYPAGRASVIARQAGCYVVASNSDDAFNTDILAIMPTGLAVAIVDAPKVETAPTR